MMMTAVITGIVSLATWIGGLVYGRTKQNAETVKIEAEADAKKAEAEKTRTETYLLTQQIVEKVNAIESSLQQQNKTLMDVKNRVIPNHGSSLDDKVTRIEDMTNDVTANMASLNTAIEEVRDARKSQGHQLGEINDRLIEEQQERRESDARIQSSLETLRHTYKTTDERLIAVGGRIDNLAERMSKLDELEEDWNK